LPEKDRDKTADAAGLSAKNGLDLNRISGYKARHIPRNRFATGGIATIAIPLFASVY
jgi:hypothetical protein